MKVNCLEKNPAVEKYYSSLTDEQRLETLYSELGSLNKIAKSILNQITELEKKRK